MIVIFFNQITWKSGVQQESQQVQDHHRLFPLKQLALVAEHQKLGWYVEQDKLDQLLTEHQEQFGPTAASDRLLQLSPPSLDPAMGCNTPVK